MSVFETYEVNEQSSWYMKGVLDADKGILLNTKPFETVNNVGKDPKNVATSLYEYVRGYTDRHIFKATEVQQKPFIFWYDVDLWLMDKVLVNGDKHYGEYPTDPAVFATVIGVDKRDRNNHLITFYNHVHGIFVQKATGVQLLKLLEDYEKQMLEEATPEEIAEYPAVSEYLRVAKGRIVMKQQLKNLLDKPGGTQ